MDGFETKIKININIDNMKPIDFDSKNNKITFFKNETINLLLNIYNNNDMQIDFSTSEEKAYSFILYAKYNDVMSEYQSDNICVENGFISIKLNSNMSNKSGTVKYQLKIIDNNENIKYLPIIICNVEDTIYFDNINNDNNENIEDINYQILALKKDLKDVKDQIEIIKKTTNNNLLEI